MRSEIDGLLNKPVEFVVGTRGRQRKLLLEEPPLAELQDMIDSSLERFVELYREHRGFFDGILDQGPAGMDLRGLMPLSRQLASEICTLAEACDGAGESQHKIADIISTRQLLRLVPVLVDVINFAELKETFNSALAAVGISLSPEKEQETVPGDSSPAHWRGCT